MVQGISQRARSGLLWDTLKNNFIWVDELLGAVREGKHGTLFIKALK